MQIVDRMCRIQMNTWGGVTIYFPAVEKKAAFTISNTIGGKWRFVYSDSKWTSEACWDSPLEALWAAYGWGKELHSDEIPPSLLELDADYQRVRHE